MMLLYIIIIIIQTAKKEPKILVKSSSSSWHHAKVDIDGHPSSFFVRFSSLTVAGRWDEPVCILNPPSFSLWTTSWRRQWWLSSSSWERCDLTWAVIHDFVGNYTQHKTLLFCDNFWYELDDLRSTHSSRTPRYVLRICMRIHSKQRSASY